MPDQKAKEKSLTEVVVPGTDAGADATPELVEAEAAPPQPVANVPSSIDKPAVRTDMQELAPAEEEVLRKSLPRLWTGLPIVFLMVFPMLMFGFIFNAMPNSFPMHLLYHLPMQVYWTFCLYRVSQVYGQRYRTAPPVSGMTICVISYLAFICAPMFPSGAYFGPSRFIDPSFWLWFASQSIFPIAMGAFMGARDEKYAAQPWKNSLRLWLMSTWFILLGAFSSDFLGQEPIFDFLWLSTQFSLISGYSLYIRRSLPKRAGKAVSDEKVMEYQGDELIVRYRSFASIERWMKQRMGQQNLKNNAKNVMKWVIGPLAIVFTLVAMLFLSWYSSITHSAAAVTAAQANFNVQLIANTITTILAFIVTAFGAYLCAPTHLSLGPNGIRMLWRHKLNRRDGKLISWDQINHIAMQRPPGKTSPLDDVLTFSLQGNKTLGLKVNSIDSVEAKEAILRGINRFGPNISRDANVVEALQPPADHSYTELWLQALSAPPKRERLKPLVEGAVLRDSAYKVQGTLGVGGQGQAYLATDCRDGKTVVLKEFILPVYVDVSVRRSALEAFENEARILRHLEHPQIVQLLDFFIEDHRAYLVLEHIDGASLRQIIEKDGPMPEERVRALADQMCEILGYLHGLTPPVVHRDFTPDNLILTADGRLKLIDFNVAKQVESTTVGTVVGKHAYLPPEQFRGMPVPQSDLYAMGCTLFYLLTGQDPEPISVSHPRKFAPQISENIDHVVEKSTALDTGKRYSSAQEIHADLRDEIT